MTRAPRRRRSDALAEHLGLDYVAGLRSRRLQTEDGRRPAPRVQLENERPEDELLVSTSHEGLLRISDGIVERVGNLHWTYGLSLGNDKDLVFEEVGRRGRLLTVEWDVPRIAVWGLPGRLHQIERLDDDIVAADSYNNRLLRIRLPISESQFWRACTTSHYPAGRLKRSAENYAHFNSLFVGQDTVCVVAHNDYARTGRMSCLWLLDQKLNVIDRRDLQFANCHNYWTDGSSEMLLASHDGHLVVNDEVAFSADAYLRGLAVTDHHIYIGGSDRFARPRRGRGNGSIFVLTRDLVHVGTVSIPGTQIHEVRAVAPSMPAS